MYTLHKYIIYVGNLETIEENAELAMVHNHERYYVGGCQKFGGFYLSQTPSNFPSLSGFSIGEEDTGQGAGDPDRDTRQGAGGSVGSTEDTLERTVDHTGTGTGPGTGTSPVSVPGTSTGPGTGTCTGPGTSREGVYPPFYVASETGGQVPTLQQVSSPVT